MKRDLEQGVDDAEGVEHVIRGCLDDSGSGIEVLVDTMTESHQAERIVLVLGSIDEGGHVFATGHDHVEHVQYLLVGTAVERPGEGMDAGRYRAEDIGLT